MIKKSIFTFLLTIVSITFTFAQTKKEEVNIDTLNLVNQYEYIVSKSGNWDKYKVISKERISNFKLNLADSLTVLKDVISNNELIISSQKKIEVDKIETITKLNKTITQLELEKDGIEVFGLLTKKSTYNTFVFSIIAVLFLTICILSYKFISSNKLTIRAKSTLEDLEFEYEEHRRTALEREQKVRRQLQDELNKNKLK